MKKQIIIAVVLSLTPLAAFAGPSLGIAYSNVGLSGHSGRPGIQISAGNLYSNNVVATGSATFARGFYGVHADLGKLIPAGGVSFTPYASLGFLNLNYQQQFQPSIQDVYGLAGVNLNIPIDSKVALQFGGGYGHTLTTYGGTGGAVYKGKAAFDFGLAKHVFADLDATYLHVPGQSVTEYGAGLSYHFS